MKSYQSQFHAIVECNGIPDLYPKEEIVILASDSPHLYTVNNTVGTTEYGDAYYYDYYDNEYGESVAFEPR